MSYVFDERADGGAHFEVRFARPKPPLAVRAPPAADEPPP
jgi:hypothetical protein